MAAPEYIRPQRHNSWFNVLTVKEFQKLKSPRVKFLDSFVTIKKFADAFEVLWEDKEPLHVIVKYGFICVWFGDNLETPDWPFPQLFEQDFGNNFVIVKPRLFEDTNLLDLIENNGDPIHFKTVHHWLEVKLSDHTYTPLKYSLRMQGKVKYAQSANNRFKRFLSNFIPTSEYVQKLSFHGPGFGTGEITVLPNFKAQLILAFLPLGKNDLRLHVATRVDENGFPLWLRLLFKVIPFVSLHDMVSWALARAGRDDTDGDYRIWHTKRSLKNPQLLPGEDNITKIREWMSQYYLKEFYQTEQKEKPDNEKFWAYLCDSKQLSSKNLSRFTINNEEVVAYIDSNKNVRVFEAHCPHQGAHLGYGGELHDDCISCPFHKFYFNPEGKFIGTKSQGKERDEMQLVKVQNRIKENNEIEIFV